MRVSSGASLSLLLLGVCLAIRTQGAAVKPVAKQPDDDEDDANAKDDEKPKVILILVDGVRWDYVQRDSANLKGFRKLSKGGVKAQHVEPVFPANSYPNWYSIATGLYPESHGFVQNKMFDENEGDFFLMLPHHKASERHWWNKTEPFWINAERHDLKSALFWWGGCHVAFDSVRASVCEEHTGWETPDNLFRHKLHSTLDQLDNGDLDFVGIYYGQVDHYGHANGPDSEQTKQSLRAFDAILFELINNLTARDMDDEVNVIVVSDHGMTKTGPGDVTTLDLEAFAKDIRYQLNSGSSSMILPEEGKTEQLFADLFRAGLEGVQLYKKENIPEDLHIRKSALVLPIWIQADKGYYIKQLKEERKTMSPPEVIPMGSHGYNPHRVEDMMTIFYAKGPAFKKSYTSPPLENVDYYNLLCHIFDIQGHKNNGSMDRIKELLYDEDDDDDDDDDDVTTDADEEDDDEDSQTDSAHVVRQSAQILITSFVTLLLFSK